MEKTVNTQHQTLDYEEGYHAKRHNNHAKEAYYDARAKIAISKFFKHVDKESRILDFGCGMGQNMLYLPNAVGYDISEYGLDFCRSKGLTVTNSVDDLEDNSFDVVFSSHVLEHHPHPKAMLEVMHSKLKSGGILLLVIPFERHGKSDFELDLNQHLYNWNFRNINNLLLTVGFKIQKNKYLRGGGYHKLLPLSKINFPLYRTLTKVAAYTFGIREMMILARK